MIFDSFDKNPLNIGYFSMSIFITFSWKIDIFRVLVENDPKMGQKCQKMALLHPNVYFWPIFIIKSIINWQNRPIFGPIFTDLDWPGQKLTGFDPHPLKYSLFWQCLKIMIFQFFKTWKSDEKMMKNRWKSMIFVKNHQFLSKIHHFYRFLHVFHIVSLDIAYLKMTIFDEIQCFSPK